VSHRSFVTPFTKQITQGSTLIESFSTSHGVFSTNTRQKRVEKYFGASFLMAKVFNHAVTGNTESTHSKVLVHDFASFEVGVIEMHDTFRFPPEKESTRVG
jgi:hypothetical protein